MDVDQTNLLEALKHPGSRQGDSPTAGVLRISRIAFQLQKPRAVLSNEQTEMSLVERMIDAAYEKWLNSKASAPSRTTAERSNR